MEGATQSPPTQPEQEEPSSARQKRSQESEWGIDIQSHWSAAAAFPIDARTLASVESRWQVMLFLLWECASARSWCQWWASSSGISRAWGGWHCFVLSCVCFFQIYRLFCPFGRNFLNGWSAVWSTTRVALACAITTSWWPKCGQTGQAALDWPLGPRLHGTFLGVDPPTCHLCGAAPGEKWGSACRKTFCQCTSMGALRPKPQKIIFSSFSCGKTTCAGNHFTAVERDVENLCSGGGECKRGCVRNRCQAKCA